MIEMLKIARLALTNRKGVTALEYGLIAAAVAAVIFGAFNGMFGKLSSFLSGITFGTGTGAT